MRTSEVPEPSTLKTKDNNIHNTFENKNGDFPS